MSMSRRDWSGGLVGLLFLAALPAVRRWALSPETGWCAFDGQPIQPAYRVLVVEGPGQTREFCCVRCADLWLRRQPDRPQDVVVTDEATGRPVVAAAAVFVRSTVVTQPTTGNRVHTFANPADAHRHASAARGTVLTGADRPFGPGE